MAGRSTDHGADAVRDPWQPVVNRVADAVALALSNPPSPPDRKEVDGLLVQGDDADWDLAIPLHRPAKRLGGRAPDLATRLARELPPIDGVERSFAAGPYLNLRVDRGRLTEQTLTLVQRLGDEYGGGTSSRERVCVGHTSANPTGPFHIGRIRNALIGDSFARVLRSAGHAVTTQYYVDDLGRQAAIMTWLWSRPVDAWPEPIRASLAGADAAAEKADHYLGRPYPAANEYLKEHPDADQEVQALTHAIETGHPPASHRETIRRVLDGMLASLRLMGVEFDAFVWESDLVADGSVERVVEKLRASPRLLTEENGALAIDASARGLPHDSSRIIVTRADGSTLYVTRDLAYHLQKFSEFDRVIDVLGANHLLHAKVLEALLPEVGESRRPEFVLYQYITAAGGGGMSTRKGTAVHLDDLLEEAVVRAHAEIQKRRDDLTPDERTAIAASVAAGAIRYHILRVAADKTVAFRWDDAISFEGRTGPFVQYAYARASSILRKAAPLPDLGGFSAAELATPDEWALVRSISRFPAVVSYVARTSHVHALAGAAYSLAEEFNRFYQNVPVLKAEAERASRLALVSAFHATLGNALRLLGIDRLERM